MNAILMVKALLSLEFELRKRHDRVLLQGFLPHRAALASCLTGCGGEQMAVVAVLRE